MKFLVRLRPFLLFALVCAAGVGVVLIATGASEVAPRRGIRIRTVPSRAAEEWETPGVPLDGLPALLAAEAPEVTKYETALLAGPAGPVPVKFLAWHLIIGRMDMRTQEALSPVFSLFPAPTSVEEARLYLEAPPERAVEIHSGIASIARGRRVAPAGGDDLPDQWVLTLSDRVHVTSHREGRRIELDGDHLEVEATDRRVRAVGPVSIIADEYAISGRGLFGDAGLGTFSVEEAVEVVLPTAALESGDEITEAAKTRIACRGPLTVERLDKNPVTGAVRSRVRFAGAVRAESDGDDGSPPDVLTAEELEIILVVRPKRGTGGDAVSVHRVEAWGDVVLARGEGSRAECSGLVIERRTDGEDVTMTGPVHVRHAGLLPVPVGGVESESALLTVDASEGAHLVTAGDVSSAVFDGDVIARRLGPEDQVLIELAAKRVTVESAPDTGDRMLAEGGAGFTTPAAAGQADRIEWSRSPAAREVTTLDGAPTVRLAGGKGFDLFKAAPENDGGRAKEILVLASRGQMELVSEGDRRTFGMEDEVTVVRERAGAEIFKVRAGEAAGVIAGGDLERLTATGSVVAVGKEDSKGPASYFASGDSLTWLASEEDATLTGEPALVRIVETTERVNEISARRLLLKAGGSLLTAEEKVKAVVFLPDQEGRETRPYTLDCERLEVVPADVAKAAEIGPGRIAFLVATGNLSLAGRDRTAHGDRLEYAGLATRELVLTGAPAFLTEYREIGGTRYEDRHEGAEFRLKLKDRDIDSFVAPRGGSFRLHRPYGKGTPAILGGAGGTGGTVERLEGSAKRSLFYDTRTARMSGQVRIEQSVGSGSGFRRVAVFHCDEIEASRGTGPTGRPELLAVRGRGGVHGIGDKWEIRCSTFDVDLVRHRTVVVGNPAEFTQNGSTRRLTQATYDYEQNTWIELVHARSR